jgi:multiple sugar transport system ATP-binding protein
MTLADRIVVLNAGRIEQVGTPLELYHRPLNRFVAGFIGSPKMNFLEATVQASRDGLAQVGLPDGAALAVAADVPGPAAGQRGHRRRAPRACAGARAPVEGSVRGHVQLAEHLGDTTYLHVELPASDGPLVVRTDPDNPLKPATPRTWRSRPRAASCSTRTATRCGGRTRLICSPASSQTPHRAPPRRPR